jgi:integrating conjugative element protein (TIGR03756 family)
MKKLGQSLRLTITLLACSGAQAGNINTAEILSKTAEGTLACLQWMPVGLCVWLDCSLFSCSVQTSLKIGHYNPDLVVSSYNELGKSPWTEIRQTLGIAQHAVATGILGSLLNVPIDSAGNRSEGSNRRRDHRNLIFRETDAIGHPQSVFSDLSFGSID